MLNLLLKQNNMDPVSGGLYTFVLGMLVVFLGIAVIVIFVSIAGKIFSAGNTKEPKQPKVKDEKPVVVEKVETPIDNGEVPDHIKVAIVAAITAYYEEKKSNCDFIVKKIRRF